MPGLVLPLLQRDPEAAGIREKRGHLPLHWAIRSLNIAFSMQIVIALMQAHPEALTTRTPLDGKLPIDMFQGDDAAKATLQAIMAEAARLIEREKAVVEQLDSLVVSGVPSPAKVALLSLLGLE
jgi:hypothetical protein